MKRVWERFLWASAVLMLVLSFGCESGKGGPDEEGKEEDRFQFLRREEAEPHKDVKEKIALHI